MKIIKNNYKIMVVVCEKCTSELELEVKDIHGGDAISFFYVCAACGKRNKLSSIEIPTQLLKELK